MRIGVASRSFSKHPELRRRLQEKFKNIQFNDAGQSLSGEALIDFLSGCEAAIIALEKINGALLEKLPELKFISKYGVGLDNIDQAALTKHGVRLGWTGGVNARSVAELTLGFMLSLSHRVSESNRELLSRQWVNNGGNQIFEKTIGIIGCGHIGKEVVRLIAPFGCHVLVHDILDVSNFCSAHRARQVPLQELLSKSDLITLHVPYSKETYHLISKKEFDQMKKGSMLINTSRGGIVDEQALLTALQTGHTRSAAVDVYELEPPFESPLLKLPNLIATSHIGGGSAEAILAMGQAAIDRLVELTG